MEKSLFEQMGGTYTQQGDYVLPNLIITCRKSTYWYMGTAARSTPKTV